MLVRNPDPTSMTDNVQSFFFDQKKKKIERGFFVPIKDSLEERKQIYLKTYINTYICTYIKVC